MSTRAPLLRSRPRPGPDRSRRSAASITFLLRRLHSLTGLVFGGYLIVHLLVNATIAQGGDTSTRCRSTRSTACRSCPSSSGRSSTCRSSSTPSTASGSRSPASRTSTATPTRRTGSTSLQRISAIVIVLFMLFHVLSLKYGCSARTSASTRTAPSAPSAGTSTTAGSSWLVYPIGILASCYHLANGFWTAAITWGLTISAAAQKRWGYVCAGLFVLDVHRRHDRADRRRRPRLATTCMKPQQELGHGS